MRTKIKKTKVKAIDYDVHFKYACLNCGIHHWASLKETKTKGFMIVCDCGEILYTKQIKNININYVEQQQKSINTKINNQQQENKQIENNNVKKPNAIVKDYYLSVDVHERCVKILSALGYTKSESLNMINKSYSELLVEDHEELIKYAVTNFGGYDE